MTPLLFSIIIASTPVGDLQTCSIDMMTAVEMLTDTMPELDFEGTCLPRHMTTAVRPMRNPIYLETQE